MTRFPPRNGPFRLLLRHFLGGLFDLGLLSEAGAASFTRMIFGIGATFVSLGFLLNYLYVVRYFRLGTADSPQPYLNALLADHAFLIAIPMWIAAFAAVLVGHALFPDETDLRVLGPLPVTRRSVFAAKLSAVTIFTGGFALAAQIALAPLFLLMAFGPWTGHVFTFDAPHHWIASTAGAAFAVLAVLTCQGLATIVAPGGRAPGLAATLRSLMLCALVISLPFVLRLPTYADAFAAADTRLLAMPPAWFLGLERTLLGDDRFGHFAGTAALGLAIVALAAAACYARLYRRFDAVMLRPAADGRRWGRPWRALRGRRVPSRPVFAGVRAFTAITLRRSSLHQGIVVVLSAIGVGIVINALVGAGFVRWIGTGGPPTRGLADTVAWAPFVLVFVSCLAARTAVMVPIEVRANWIFRVAEQGPERVDQLRAGAWTVARIGVVLPVAFAFPLQWLVVGWQAAAVMSTGALVCGLLLHGILMEDWTRIPFTCSYLPGKGFLPHTIILGLVSIVAFTAVGTALVRLGVAGSHGAWVLAALLGGIVLLLRRERLRMWARVPIDYEDESRTEVRSFKFYD